MKTFLSLCIAILTVLTAGCMNSSEPNNANSLPPRHKEQFDLALSGNLPDKTRTILEDYWVTDEEWNEVVNDFLNCAETQNTEAYVQENQMSFGVTLARQERINSLYEPSEAESQFNKEDKIVWDCATETILHIGIQYFGPRNNPDGVSHAESIRRCYSKNNDLSLEGLSETEIEEKIVDSDYVSNATTQQSNCMQNPAYGDWQP